MGRYRSVTVTVDVDIGDIDTDDLVEELRSRGRGDVVSESVSTLNELYYALKFGMNDKAI